MTIALSLLAFDAFLEHQAAPGCVNGLLQAAAERYSRSGGPRPKQRWCDG
jgi:hypothetical protein